MIEIDLYGKRDIWLNLPSDTTWERFCEVIDNLGTANKKIQWLIGDALLFCEGKWKERIEEAKRRTGIATSTLNGYLCVSRSYPTIGRTIELSWAHYYEALRARPEQRQAILRRALKDKWSTRDMRFALAEHAGEEREKGEKIGFLPMRWAIEIKRWLSTQPDICEWNTDNIAALKARFDKDIIPIYQALCNEIDKRVSNNGASQDAEMLGEIT